MLTDHVKVGDGGRCGMGAVVIRDVPAGVTVVGNPARDIKERRQPKHLPSPSAPHEYVTVGIGGGRRTVEPPGSHGDIRDQSWGDAFGDGSDDLSLPTPRPDMSELGQRQRAAYKGWMGAVRGPRGR
jgi:hypothetical protein